MIHHALGWSEVWDPLLEKFQVDGLEKIARVVARHKTVLPALCTTGERLNLYVPGKFLHGFSAPVISPVPGDWCVIGERFVDESNTAAAFVEALLPRRTSISRASAGTTSDEQTLAANVDVMFIVTSVNRDLNINRIRRYLMLATQGGVRPIIALSKVDLMDDDCLSSLNEIEATFPDVRRVFTSTVSGTGLAEIRSLLPEGTTAAFVGSSGVGKSTLVNALMKVEVQKTGDIRSQDARGRHTTSGSELFFVPHGGMIVDTAGLRQVGVVGNDDSLVGAMPTVAELAAACRFVDCSHVSEPGCAVQAGLLAGTLDQREFESYEQLSRELAFSRRKTDQRLAAEERKKWKQIAVNNRRNSKERRN